MNESKKARESGLFCCADAVGLKQVNPDTSPLRRVLASYS